LEKLYDSHNQKKSSPGVLRVLTKTENGLVWVERKSKRVGHTKPSPPIIPLEGPGRLRVAHVLSLLSVSHSKFYAGLNSGKYPPADGRDGNFPFWKTSTIKRFLES
jgi:hypothetical protein